MSSRTYPPSGGRATTVGPVVLPEMVGASFVLWFAVDGTGVFEAIGGYSSQGLRAGLRSHVALWGHGE